MGTRVPRITCVPAIIGVLLIAGCGGDSDGHPSPASTPTVQPTATATPRPPGGTQYPNIVFIIMDDVGIDQIEAFGLGDGDASTPNLSAIADQGVKFTNVWAMPECSPSRTSFFTGRYPLRTGVTSALVPSMLPQAQLSPYETSIPRILATVGYTSALVGKYHLGSHSPSQNCAPLTLGWNYFKGNMEAGPPSIDVQAGQVLTSMAGTPTPTPLTCGFDQSSNPGACYSLGSNSAVTCSSGGNGDQCLEAGGLFVEGPACQAAQVQDPSQPTVVTVGDGSVVLDFSRQNGYYVWPDSVLSGVLPADTTNFSNPQCGAPPLSREYMSLAQTNDAITWYMQQTGPRMISVSYNTIHTPYQQPPQSLLSDQNDGSLICGQTDADRKLGDDMLEGMDVEIGRLLSALNLADLNDNGVIMQDTLINKLTQNNTVLIIVGDNGTLGFSVKEPFDASRAKGTVYQTGVWVPLIIAGPSGVVASPGRSVGALVNVVDLFTLFAELAGINARAVVPPAHTLDGQSLLPYLTTPTPAPIRQYNFTQLGEGVFVQPQDNDTRSWPCVLNGTQCDDVLIDTQSLCHTNSGIWWGQTTQPDPEVVAAYGGDVAKAEAGTGSCCLVNQILASQPTPSPTAQILPVGQAAVRDQRYKLVQLQVPDCVNATQDDLEKFPPTPTMTQVEFYDLQNTSEKNPLGLDEDGFNLLCQPATPPVACKGIPTAKCTSPTACLTSDQLNAYSALQAQLSQILSSDISCPGDGNLDKRVDQRDMQGVQDFTGDQPSFFDFNLDGKTDQLDAQIVTQYMNTDCLGICRRSDLNSDGVVNDVDLSILNASLGTTCDLCAADLDDNGVVNAADSSILQSNIGCTLPSKRLAVR